MSDLQTPNMSSLKEIVLSGTLGGDQLVKYYMSSYAELQKDIGYDDKALIFEVLSMILLKLTRMAASKKYTQQLDIREEDTIVNVAKSLDHSNRSLVNMSITNYLNKVIGYLKLQNQHSPIFIYSWACYMIQHYVNSKVHLNVLEILIKNLEDDVGQFHREHLQLVTGLFENFSSDAMANATGKVLVAMYKKLYISKQRNTRMWFCLWNSIVFDKLGDKRCSKNIRIYLLPQMFKIDLSSFGLFINKFFNNKDDILQHPETSERLIDILKIGVHLGLKYAEIAPVDVSELITGSSINMRLSCLELLCYSTKASESFDDRTLLIVANNLFHIVMDLTSIETRSTFINTMSMILTRLRDSYIKLRKKKQVPHSYSKFVSRILRFIQQSILPNTTYQQTIVALELLKKLASLNFLNTENCSTPTLDMKLYSDTLVGSLLDNIHHNFEDIRLLTAELVVNCPRLIEDHFDDPKSAHHPTNVLPLCFSLKSRVSDGAALYFEVVAKVYNNHGKSLQSVYQMLNDQLVDVQFHPKLSNTTRIHGILQAFRLMIENTPLSHFTQHSTFWNQCFQQMLYANDVIFEDVIKFLYETSHSVNPDYDLQLVSSFSWRFIKESTELMIRVFDCLHNVQADLFLAIDFTTYIETLTSRILRVNHMGTISSLESSLVSLIEMCYKSQQYSSFPQSLLLDCLNAVEYKSKLIGRRSGGLPMVITAILIGASGSNVSDQEMPTPIQLVFQRLLPLPTVEASDEEHKFDLPQVNALNCIKAIVDDTKLAQACQEYYNGILLLCLNTFNSKNWSIRNCSLMLFSSLKSKLFSGTKIPSNVFFQTYAVKPLLVEYLESGDTEIAFPILTILANLSFDNDLVNLSEFTFLLKNLLGSPDWKIREMCARTWAGMLPESQHLNCVTELGSVLRQRSSNRNTNHGYFLIILEIVKLLDEYKSLDFEDIHVVVLSLTSSLSWAELKVYVDIIRHFNMPPDTNWQLGYVLTSNLTGELKGIKLLAMKEILSYLLEVENDPDLIELTIDINHDFSNIVLDHILKQSRKVDLKPVSKYLDYGDPDKQLMTKGLACLDGIPIEQVTSHILDILQSYVDSPFEEVSYHAVRILSRFHPHYYVDFFDSIDKDTPKAIKEHYLEASYTYVNESGGAPGAPIEQFFQYLKLLSDEDESIRTSAAKVLSRVMKLRFPKAPYALYDDILFYLDQHDMDRDDFADPFVELLKYQIRQLFETLDIIDFEITTPNSLFVGELQNPYRADPFILENLIASSAIICDERKPQIHKLLVSALQSFDDKMDHYSKVGHTWNEPFFHAIASASIIRHFVEEFGPGITLSPKFEHYLNDERLRKMIHYLLHR